MQIGPVFARVLPAGETVEIENEYDIQIANIALATHKPGRTTVKLHYIRVEESDSDFSDAEDEDEEEDSSNEMEAELKPKANGIVDEEPKGEDVTVVLCSLYAEKLEQATVNILLPSDEAYELIVEGPNDVHILGNEVLQDADMPPVDDYPYDSYDSEIDDSEIDSELAEDEGGVYDPETGLPMEYDSEDDDLLDVHSEDDDDESEDDSARFAELKEDLDTPLPTPKVNGIDADLLEADSDAMDAEDKVAADVDMSKLSKSQKKKLKKKLATEGAGNVQSVVGKKTEKVTISKDGKKTDEVKSTAQVVVNGANGKDVKAIAKKQSKKVTLPNGTQTEDMKIGDGAAAKAGSKVSLRYIGKLKDGKIFDSNTKGKPFSFKLGKGEVIKGWESGIEGMRPGGERRLTIPPSAAYGKQGTDGIPPNSVLTFDVKLISVA